MAYINENRSTTHGKSMPNIFLTVKIFHGNKNSLMFTQFICKIVRALDQKLGRSNPAGTMIRDFDVTEIDP